MRAERGLPGPIRRIIDQTVHAAELDDASARIVRQDLVLHFRDGLRAGRSPDQLIDEFGDPQMAARLIAESRRASRSSASGSLDAAGEGRGFARGFGSVRADLRYAFRGLRRTPGFTIVAVLTIALGIGVNTAIFSVVRAVLLSSLPLEDSHLLVRPYFSKPSRGIDRAPAPYIDLLEWREQTDVFDVVADYAATGVDFEGDPPIRVFGAQVSLDFFRLYRVAPTVGRLFTADDYVGSADVVVLAKTFWETRYGADPGVLGTTLRLDRKPATVIGVADETATWPTFPQFWIPRILPPSASADYERRDNFTEQLVARLQAGVPIEQARVRLAEMARRVAQDEPAAREGWEARIVSLRAWIVGPQLPRTLLVLMGAATLVLLIASTNVASLLATRTAARRKQLAIRVAMGAGPWQVARHLLAESVVLFVAGGVIGGVLAVAAIDPLLALAPPNLPRISGAEISAVELAFAIGVAAVSGFGFGMYPAWHMRRESPTVGLRDGGASSVSRTSSRFRQGLVVAEVVLSVILLAGAGLMLRSLGAMNTNDPGFRFDHLVTFGLVPPSTRYAEAEDVELFYDRVLERLEAVPGVMSASTTTYVPIGGGGIGLGRVHLAAGMPEPPAGPDYAARWMVVGEDLMDVMDWPVRRGRVFRVADAADAPPVAVINEAMAAQMFPGEDPIGQRVRSWRDENVYREIVGVVGDVRLDGVAAELTPLFLVPSAQVQWDRFRNVVVRTQVDPATILPHLQPTVAAVDPLLPVTNPRTGEDIFGASVASSRFIATLLGVFATLAVVVAALGLYGLISSAVTNRTKELGIRTALGSRRGQTIGLVMGDGLRLAGIGVVLGIMAAVPLTTVMSGLLFEVSARDPVTYLGIVAGSLAVALAASYVPARRATRVDPVRALRSEQG